MTFKKVASALTGCTHLISSHVRNIDVTRYKNVVILEIPLYSEAKELAEIIDILKDEHSLKITYSVKKEFDAYERHD